MRRVSEILRDYFGFSATEMRGFWVLMVLCVLSLLITPLIKTLLYQPYTFQASTEQQQELDSLINLLENPPLENKPESHFTARKVAEEKVYISFDPNQASIEVLIQNGFPKWLAERLIKYRERGGKYYVKSDLLKIYGFPTHLYQQIETYIELPEKVTHSSRQKTYSTSESTKVAGNEKFVATKKEISRMDINRADSITLRQVPGIGPVFSSRIIRFRDGLGGIYNLDQLTEIYQISPEVVENLKKYTYVSQDFEVQKVNINTDDVSTLAKHPYISYPLARAIVQHREDYGAYQQLNDCKEVYLMDEITFQKIASYLSL